MPITFENVTHIYSKDTPFQYAGLKGVQLEIAFGKITAIIGQTGSGKSTLVQHLNALLLPSSGKVTVLDRKIYSNQENKGLKALRAKVGLVFQFPEYQLFEETVLKDVAFGPKNFGVSEEDAIKKAKNALRLVGLDESFEKRSPLDLSGGQKRRVAIAGILAIDPEVLVLDEPTAGLDPQGASEMMKLFIMLHKKYQKTILLVSHDMEQVYTYCDNVVLMKDGKNIESCSVDEFFNDETKYASLGVVPPNVIRAKMMLEKNGFSFSDSHLTLSDLAKQIAKQVKKHG